MRTIFSLEEIVDIEGANALNDHVDAQEEASKTGDFDALHESNEKLVNEENAENAQDDAIEAEGDTGTEDEIKTTDDVPVTDKEASDDAPVNPEGEEALEEPSDIDGKRQTAVTESFRNEYYSRLILESFGDIGSSIASSVSTVASGGAVAATYLGSKMFDGAIALKDLGVQYGPGVLAHLKKGVLYLFIKSVKLVLKTANLITKKTKAYTQSFSRHKADVRALRSTLAELSIKGDLELAKPSTSDSAFVSWFTAGGKMDPFHATEVISGFVGTAVSKLDSDIAYSLQVIEKLIAQSAKPMTGNQLGFLSVPPFTGGHLKKSIPGHSVDLELNESFVYGRVLPDYVLFAAILPKPGLKTIEEITEAYRESGMFLTSAPSPAIFAEKVDYMDATNLVHFLDVLESLCDLGLKHVSFYEKVSKASSKLKFDYRHYYQTLTESKDQADLRSSLVEYVYLKQSFISRIYVPAAVDIHDYTSAYIVRAMRFAKENIKALRVKSTEPTESTD